MDIWTVMSAIGIGSIVVEIFSQRYQARINRDEILRQWLKTTKEEQTKLISEITQDINELMSFTTTIIQRTTVHPKLYQQLSTQDNRTNTSGYMPNDTKEMAEQIKNFQIEINQFQTKLPTYYTRVWDKTSRQPRLEQSRSQSTPTAAAKLFYVDRPPTDQLYYSPTADSASDRLETHVSGFI